MATVVVALTGAQGSSGRVELIESDKKPPFRPGQVDNFDRYGGSGILQ